MALSWQPSFLVDEAPDLDRSFARLEHRDLGSGAWLAYAPAWVAGADALFATVLEQAPWSSRQRHMYDRVVAEPRLTTRSWSDPPEVVCAIADALSARFDRDLHAVSANLYRDGRDSVAWHGDRVGRRLDETVVALVSLGSPRRFLLRPRGGGRSRRIVTNAGDLLVLGGTCQRTWQHSVPKCASAGPRISVMFREGY